jgi:hypothetical protein
LISWCCVSWISHALLRTGYCWLSYSSLWLFAGKWLQWFFSLLYLWSCLNIMLCFYGSSKFAWCRLKLLFVLLRCSLPLNNSNLISHWCYSCLIFDFNMNWTTLCHNCLCSSIIWLLTLSISVHSIIHHATFIHTRSLNKWILTLSSISWLLNCWWLLLSLINSIVLRILNSYWIIQYISTNNSKCTWVFALTVLLLDVHSWVILILL